MNHVTTTKQYCDTCEKETEHTETMKEERWQDQSIDDDELSQNEVIDRMNGDTTYIVSCSECHNTFEIM